MGSLNRERRHWEDLAATDPMWVILTEPGREGKWNSEEFFESGREEIAGVFSRLATLALEPSGEVAMDFGCGLGRLSQALAERFHRVHGVDISKTMVDGAAERNRHGARVTYHANAVDRLPMFTDGSVSFIYSRLTLQHIPRAAAEAYIAEFARVLAPRGICVFQVLTRARRLSVRVRHRVREAMPDLYRAARDLLTRQSRWEMNVVPERRVIEILEGAGLAVKAITPEEAGGPEFESHTFVAVRPPISVSAPRP